MGENAGHPKRNLPGSAVHNAPVLVVRITQMVAALGNAVLVAVTLSSPDHVPVVSVPRTARVSGVRCTVDGPRFALRSVALLPPVLHVWSELVPNIATIPNVCPVRPDTFTPSRPPKVRICRLQSCSEPVHAECSTGCCTLHCSSARCQFHATPNGSGAELRRATDP